MSGNGIRCFAQAARRPARRPLGAAGDRSPTPGLRTVELTPTEDPATIARHRRHGRGRPSSPSPPAGRRIGADPDRPVAHLEPRQPAHRRRRRRRRTPSTCSRSAPGSRTSTSRSSSPAPSPTRSRCGSTSAAPASPQACGTGAVRGRRGRPRGGVSSTLASTGTRRAHGRRQCESWRSTDPTPGDGHAHRPGHVRRHDRGIPTHEQPVQRGARRHPHRALGPGAHRPRRRDVPRLRRRDDRRQPRRARRADRHRRRRRGRPAWCSAATTPTTRGSSARARPQELHELCLEVDADTVVFDNELSPGPAVQPGEAARPHGDRPHRGDPRHLRPERPHARGQGPGRAGPAALPPAPPAPRRRRPSCPSSAAASAPASAAARRSSRSTGGASSAASAGSRRELEELDRTRHLQRQQRDRSGLAAVTIVGYTNAGKSTLLNTLTDAGVLSEDRLFATLDPTTRRLALPGGEPVLLTDTVGFVRRLPARPRRVVQEHARGRHRRRLPRPRRRRQRRRPAGPDRRRARGAVGDRRRPACPSCSCSTRPTWRRCEAKRLVADHPGLGRRSAPSTGEGIDDLLRVLADRLRSLTAVVELAVPVRPRRRAGGDPPRGRGRVDDRRRRHDARAGPPVRGLGRAAAPSSSSCPAGDDDGRGDADASSRPHRLRPAAVPVRPARRPAARSADALRRGRGRPVDRHADRPAAGGRRRRAVDVGHASGATRRASARVALRSAVAAGSRAASTSTSIRPRSAPASAPRSSSARCRSGCSCARPSATRSCTRRSSYPTYEMGAILAGCRPVPVPMTPDGRPRPRLRSSPTDADRALALWVNSPGNPTGALDDLGAAAAWGRRHGVPVFSDECYVEFTWDGPAAVDPAARPRRRRRRALAVEALEPGRRRGSASTPATPSSSTTSRRCASTSG